MRGAARAAASCDKPASLHSNRLPPSAGPGLMGEHKKAIWVLFDWTPQTSTCRRGPCYRHGPRSYSGFFGEISDILVTPLAP